MTDWLRISTLSSKSNWTQRSLSSDQESFEKKLRLARERGARDISKAAINIAEHDAAQSSLQQINTFCYLNDPHVVKDPCVAWTESTGQFNLNRLRPKLWQKIIDQLKLSDHQTFGQLVTATADRQWTIDLSDLINKKITLNLTRDANGRWDAALNTSTDEYDPLLRQLCEQLTDLIHSRESQQNDTVETGHTTFED